MSIRGHLHSSVSPGYVEMLLVKLSNTYLLAKMAFLISFSCHKNADGLICVNGLQSFALLHPFFPFCFLPVPAGLYYGATPFLFFFPSPVPFQPWMIGVLLYMENC